MELDMQIKIIRHQRFKMKWFCMMMIRGRDQG